MSKINILDSSIYNLIAAGEVVERPASVIKELVENSIDAGATKITIEIKDGGTTFMQVSDDGCGIEEADFKSAFLPHATSKIKNANDLDSISTLGFRGEALASIASVAKVTLTSKTKDFEIGNTLQVEGGKFGEISKCGANQGTTITVKDLFFCVPARAKFLKKNKTEEQEITNIITRIILANPKVNFKYIVDGKIELSSIGTTEKEAIFSIYGKEAVKETLEVSGARENISIKGFVGRPTYSKSNRTYQTLIINGRYVVNTTIQSAVSNAYGDFLMKRQYPFFVLYLDIPFDEIDVNVHPNKLDVKFLNSNLVYSVVFQAVSKALNEMDYIKDIETPETTQKTFVMPQKQAEKIDKAGVNLNPYSVDVEKMTDEEKDELSDKIIDSMLKMSDNDTTKVRDNFGLGSRLLEKLNEKVNFGDKTAYETPGYNVDRKQPEPIFEKVILDEKDSVIKNKNLTKNSNNIGYGEEKIEPVSFVKPKTEQTDFASDEIKFIGKIFNTYLIIEWGDGMFLIDQHAAHERIRYDKLKAEYESGNIVVQPMLLPYVLTLNAEDDQILNANLSAILSLGFEIEEFGEKSYKISAVPAIVSDIDFNKFFSMFLAEKLVKNKLTQAELVKDSLMQMACKSAVKGGDDLSKDEILKLLKDVSREGFVLFCPHGRPVVVKVSKNEIEKWFKRIV